MKDNIATEGNMFKSEVLSQKLDENTPHHTDETPIPSRKCVVVGGTSLAVSCAEQIQSAGHIIQAVLSTDSVLQTWAEQQGIDWVNSVEELQEHIQLQPVDWLFSIVNPLILPASLIKQIRGGAFNYHDSPLPRYAGSHATSWALLAREIAYAISWHCIEGAVNGGNIAVQWPVSIEEQDTAFLLNLKCYQAAQKGFNELLTALSHDTLITYPQNLSQRRFYALSHRPEAGGYLCWKQPGEVLSALVRALDFGENDANPLGYPKLLLKQDTVRISWLQRLGTCSGEKPGTLIRVEEEGWQVSTGSEDVRIGGFSTLEGQLLSVRELTEISELQPGEQLPLISPQQAQNIKNTLQKFAPDEPFWCQRLTGWQPSHLPFDISHKTAEPRWAISPWQSAFSQKSQEATWKTLLQAFVIYLTRLTQQTVCQVGWYVGANEELSNMASMVPMTVEAEFNKPWSEVVVAVDNELALLAQHGTYSRDLFSRFPALSVIPELRTCYPWPIAVSVVPDSRLGDQERSSELLTFQINTQGGFRWIYDENRLDTAVILRMSEHLQQLLSLEKTNEAIPIGQLNLLSETERMLLLKTWNATAMPYPEDLYIHQLFEQQVAKTPEATALVYENQSLSYAELNTRANRLAHQLIALGVEPDQRVAICVSRSPAMVVGLLAVLKAGGAYVSLDPSYPVERLAYMLNDAAPVVLLTQSVLADSSKHAFSAADYTIVLLDAPDAAQVEQPDHNPEPQTLGLTSRHPAYIIYTSGSTGLPKGVEMPQAGLLNLLQWHRQSPSQPAGNGKTLQFAALGFDVAFQEIFTTLCEGGCLVLINESLRRQPEQLLRLISQQRIDRIFLPYIALQHLAEAASHSGEDFSCLAHIVTAGEQLRITPAIQRFLQRAEGCRLHNHYGPTESHVTTAYILDQDPNRWPTLPPIGRPIANNRIYILDTCGQPVPLGGLGEIYIAGQGVARGYLNRPELTAERFLADPFSDKPDARMYRTGDLARYLPDGNLEFLGRTDQQVKIRGFRIEPGEIEARLAEHPAVREAVVLARGEGLDKRLVAYVAADVEEELVNNLRERLSQVLPEYMVPAAVVRLDRFPLTPNGKLDRRALPVPGEDAFARQRYAAPQGATETALAAIWRELLGIEKISRHDNFFALGGHSLLAVRVIEHLRQQGLTLAVRDLFQTPVLANLAQKLEQYAAVPVSANVITPDTCTLTPAMLPLINLTPADIDRIVGQVPGGLSNLQDIYALSPLQDGILFHHLLASEGDPYLLAIQMIFADRALLDRYLTAVQQVVNRHDILRTAFIWQGLSEPAQVVWRQAPLSVTELTLDPADGPVSEQLSRRFDPRHYRLNLSEAPLLQFVVARDTEGRWCLLELQHHLIGDHTTLEVLHREIRAFLTEQAETLPAPVPFRNLVAQARLGVSQTEHIRFFSEMLAGVDEPTLPFGLTEVHRDGSQVAESHRMLAPELNDRLRGQARRLGVSLAALCHLAWAQVLSHTSDQEQVVFGTVLFGRMATGEGADNGMGLFINTLPLRLDINNTPVQDSVRAAHTRLAGLLEHEHASLALAQRCSGVQGEIPLFSSLLNYRHNALSATLDGQIDGIEFLEAHERTNYPLVLSVEDFGEALGLTAQVVQPFEPERICGYMQQALESLVEALEQAPKMPVRQLKIVPETERTLLLTTWNATETTYPDVSCIHQLFEQQVEQAPDAIALVYEDQVLSYAELNARANRLAHQLIALGVEPDQRVAICVSRSPTMVVGVLAILKAGGAYVPLDPVYTGERLAHILTDAAPAMVLADDIGRDALGEKTLAGLTVLDPNILPDQPDGNPQLSTLTSRHLAYVIYTSGSTGTPKGVMVEHRNILRLFEATESWYHFNRQDVWCLFHSIAFDFSVWELWGALRYGAKLVLVPHAIARSPQELHQFVCQHGITVLNQTPSAFKAFIASYVDNPLPDQLRYIIFGGEALEPGMLRPWYRLREETSPQLVNMYGITETTVHVTYRELNPHDVEQITSPIGARIPDLTLYLLDKYGQPVPLGAEGELYVGGAGVARGYLNRPELTAERFLIDPFSDRPDARMYRTGDLARYLPKGDLVFVGRNDQQVKIRGFRIEPGEIETRLIEHPAVREAAVLALGDGPDKRLVAYVAAPVDDGLVNSLRTHLSKMLPDYMVPSAFVRLDAFPLTPNGKLDRRVLPAPDGEAFARQIYAAPQGKTEIALTAIWRELLGIEQISRYDSFFALGGHSLLAVRMIERLRHLGLTLAVRDLFQSPVLSELAQTLGQYRAVAVPPNVITSATTIITPEMLPLVDLTQADIDCIVGQVPGGMTNIQDIYALSPLQDGILFHHLLANEGDPYLVVSQIAFADRALLDRYLVAVQQVVDRHDILRTAFIWRELSVPVQVVWRQAALSVMELDLNPADGRASDQLTQRFDPRHHRLDLGEAPLLRFVVAQEVDGRWIVQQLLHHLIGDHTTLDVMNREVQAYLNGQEESLPAPTPFRNLVAQARLGVSQEEHTRFFTDMLVEVDEPTLPFGLTEVHRDGSQVTESHRMLSVELNNRLRHQARHLSVSLAALCHLAWAQVLSCTSGQEQVVFGTVLFGRMAAGDGADSGMGLFINTLPLRLDIDDTPVRDSVQAAHTRLAGLLAHEHASLALAQRCSSVASGTPLFNALLNYRHNLSLVTLDETMEGIEFLSGQERTNYPFTLSVEDFGDALGLTAQIVQPFDPDRICGYMQQALESLVEALAHTPDRPVGALDILPAAERALLLTTWNATETPYPEDLCIHQLFERQAATIPDAIALVHENQSLSYAELNARANQLAHQLITLGVVPDQLVVICVSRSPAMVVGILAILKAGGAYVPLDPAYPGERLAHMLTDAAPAIILADETGRTALGEKALAGRKVLDPNSLPEQPDSNPQIAALIPCHLAYVIYTSGSTGAPKGVMVEHQAIYQRYLGFNETYAVTAQDRILQFSSFAFDASVEEFFSSLCHGATLVMRDDNWLSSIQAFISLTQQNRITVMSLPTLFWSELAGRDKALRLPDCLRLIIIGGEEMKTRAIQDWFAQETHHPRLLNTYGPTENTVIATCQAILSPEDDGSIGRPVSNTCIYLLDRYGQPVPLGCIGELYIGGVGVARGYLNQPELTAERFLADPFSGKPHARMYRTGDLARYLPDGNLEFLGRTDQQVKIRGFRIEPGEIEARLAEYPAVREAVVLAYGKGLDKRLVAYVAADVEEGLVNNLRERLSQVLPEYMVPAAVVRLDRFPLTPNGKLDRRALPVPGEDAFARQRYAAPQGATETALAAVWRELLGIEKISRHDNFFALGGHSLLAVRVIEHLRQQGLTLAVRDLFQTPVLANLAQKLAQYAAVPVPANVITPDTCTLTPAMLPLINLTPADIDRIVGQVPGGLSNLQDIYALSPLQDGILFHHLLASEGDPYLLTGQMVFAAREVLDRYLAAVQQVVNRHDILRTAFIWQGLSEPAQVVWRQAPLSVTELTLDPADGPVSEQLSRRFDPRHYRLNLSEAPLLQFVVARDTEGRWCLLELQHHLIGDHTTLEVLHREIRAFLTEQAETLPAPVPFRNLVARARLGRSQEEHTRFFTDMLSEVTEPTLPFGVAEVHRDGSQVTEFHRMLPAELNDRLRRQAQQLGVSLATLCHLAWAQVLSRTSGQEKVVFGTVLFGRMAAGAGAGTGMGLFINTLPLRLDIDNTPVRESVRQAQSRLAGLLAHEHASLALAQRCSSIDNAGPLFSALLNYRHNDVSALSDEGLSGIEFMGGQERTNYPFALSVEDFGTALGLTAQVVEPFGPERVCDYMQQALDSLAEALAHTPDRPVRALDILPAAERTLLLTTWNATETPYPEDLCIHQLFERQAATTPDAIALVYENQSLSYAELNARANRLAHQLITLGVVPDQLVAICVSRSLVMVVGILAILKAGGAYMPLDPAYPDERLAYMFEDAAPVAVLTQTEWVDRLASTVPTVVLDAQTQLWMSYSTDNPDPQVLGLTSHHLAYVIYTSGSTGQPKGVMNSHQALCNRLLWFVRNIATTPLVGALKTSISFVDSVTEMLGVLLAGGKLVVFNDHEVKDFDRFSDGLRRFGVNYLVVVPSLLKHLIQGYSDKLKSIRTLVCSGERLAPELARQVVTDYPWLRLLNFYGSSEINGDATWYEYPTQTEIPEVSVIGRPIANTQIYLLDPIGQPVPLGVVGEIYIAGAGVAHGYLNRPELTAEHFLHDLYSDKPDARMYRTGDLARYRPDGNLEFLGRNDQQVKIRGFRIEPEEIEAQLMEHPAVRGSVVLALDDGSDKRLVAYVMADAEEGLVNSLRIHLNSVLPDYMVPAAFVRLESFPLTANGKLDKQALPAPDSDAFARQHYEAPQGATEILLATIWHKLLGIEQISRHDNFFALGGHSLLAVRMMNLAAGQGLNFTLNTLFQFPVLVELAVKITLDPLLQRQNSAISVRPGGTGLPLFLIPTGTGDYSYAFGLSQYISSGYPIYALPWPSINEEPMSTMEELAAKMVTLMKAVQSTGPYRIGGYSSGGILAYAIAQQLLNAGEQVNFLGMIDTLAPHYLREDPLQPKYRFLVGLTQRLEGEHLEEISVLHQNIEALNLVQLIEAAQELELYPATLRADVVAKYWEQIARYAQLIAN